MNTIKLIVSLYIMVLMSPAMAAEQIFFFHSDHLGTPQELTDVNQNVVWKAEKDPFGDAAPAIALVENNLRFPGQYFDGESGLHYNWNRYYDPQTGRYITSDPIGLDGGINTYGYVGQNPLYWADPMGLKWYPPSISQGFEDFSAGFGDVLTFGIGKQIRNLSGIGSVNECSGAYSIGEVAGIVGSIATGFVGGTKAVARASSPNNWQNFSHSLIPHSALKKINGRFAKWLDRTGNRLNGDHVPPGLHTRMDAGAQFGVSRAHLAANPLFGSVRQAINRIPFTLGASVYGISSYGLNNATNDCGCE